MFYLLDVGSTLSKVENAFEGLLEYDLDSFVEDIVEFLDTFITNIFFLSNEQSEELERLFYAIVQLIEDILDDLTRPENSYGPDKKSNFSKSLEVVSAFLRYNSKMNS